MSGVAALARVVALLALALGLAGCREEPVITVKFEAQDIGGGAGRAAAQGVVPTARAGAAATATTGAAPAAATATAPAAATSAPGAGSAAPATAAGSPGGEAPAAAAPGAAAPAGSTAPAPTGGAPGAAPSRAAPPSAGKKADADCQADADCITIQADCCGCSAGGSAQAVPARRRIEAIRAMDGRCQGVMCVQMISNHPTCRQHAACRAGRCVLEAGPAADR